MHNASTPAWQKWQACKLAFSFFFSGRQFSSKGNLAEQRRVGFANDHFCQAHICELHPALLVPQQSELASDDWRRTCAQTVRHKLKNREWPMQVPLLSYQSRCRSRFSGFKSPGIGSTCCSSASRSSRLLTATRSQVTENDLLA